MTIKYEQNSLSYLRTHLALILPLSPVHVMMRKARRVAAHGAHLWWQITSVLRIGDSLAHLGCIDGLRHDQHPRARGGRGEGDREVRVRGRRGWAGGLWPLGGRVMRVEARHELILLQATSFSPWDEKTSIWYNFSRGIYIKLPRLYTITWSREGYLFCQCHKNVNWRALIKNKSRVQIIQETM